MEESFKDDIIDSVKCSRELRRRMEDSTINLVKRSLLSSRQSDRVR